MGYRGKPVVDVAWCGVYIYSYKSMHTRHPAGDYLKVKAMTTESAKRVRQHTSKAILDALQAARARRSQFLADTGIDLKAMVMNSFDANSGRQRK